MKPGQWRRCRWKRRSGANAARSSTATATTATADRTGSPYVGRFAPTPSGDLHLGSLYAAAASYLDARSRGGRWLLRIEDLDALREVAGAADRMQRTLELFGFQWDGRIERQRDRLAHYAAALASLRAAGLIFACGCSRAMLPDDGRYPGTCRHAGLAETAGAARVRVEAQHIEFHDRVQGRYGEDIASSIGDFIVRRRDAVYAYQLAVVVDDAAQGITDVVRGADLLDNTPRQIYLQRALKLREPRYAHVPLLVDGGGKLSKSRQSLALDEHQVIPQLLSVFGLLGLSPPADAFASVEEVWRFGMENFDMDRVPKRVKLQLSA